MHVSKFIRMCVESYFNFLMFHLEEDDSFVGKISGLFHPPEEGDYRFILKANMPSKLYISNEGDFGPIDVRLAMVSNK